MRRIYHISSGLMLSLCLSCNSLVLGQQFTKAEEKPNRFEGLLPEFNSKPKYQIRGVFAGQDIETAGQDEDLKVTFYVPPNATLSTLRAWELHNVLNYRMQAKIDLIKTLPGSWATFAHWPVRDVLAPNGILPSNLGVLVTLRDRQTPDFFAPALFYVGTPPKTVSTYTIYLASDSPVQKLRCVVHDYKGSATSPSGFPYHCDLPEDAHTMPPNIPGRFTVKATDLPSGPVSVTIVGEYQNDESGARLRAEIHFFHQPQVDVR